MKITVKKNTVKFDPIIVDVQFEIASYEDLKEFITFNEDHGDVCQYNGDKSYPLTDIMEAICEEVSKGI